MEGTEIISCKPHHHTTQHHNHFSSSAEPTTCLPFSPHSHSHSHSLKGVLPSSSTSAPRPPETLKRKRGRPRKYGTTTPDPPSTKLSSSKHHASNISHLGNAGQGFTPHIISVAAGEDVSQKVLSFVQQRRCAVCILSASGSVSNASLRQSAMLGRNVTYEGRYEILSLSGSFLYKEVGGASSRTGGLAVCLSGTDGHIIGGGVGGSLRAAGSVQVVAGSFLYDVCKNGTADEISKASHDKLLPRVHGASVSSVTSCTGSDSFGRSAVGENNNHLNFGGNIMVQPRGMDIRSPPLNDWRGDLDARNDIDFTGRMDHGDQSRDDVEQLDL